MNLRALQQIQIWGESMAQWGEHLPPFNVIQVQFPVLIPDLINQHFQNNSNSI